MVDSTRLVLKPEFSLMVRGFRILYSGIRTAMSMMVLVSIGATLIFVGRHAPAMPVPKSRSRKVRSILWGPKSKTPMQRPFLSSLPPRTRESGDPGPVLETRKRTAKADTALSRLQKHIVELADSDMDQYYLGRETFISDRTTLYARTRGYQHTTYHGQICCVMPEQSTVAVELHPEDSETVVKAGWGARQQQPAKPWLSASKELSTATKTLVFAPRHEEDLKVVEDIISAAAWWVRGIDSREPSTSWT